MNKPRHSVHVEIGTRESIVGDTMTWLNSHGWLCHRMGHIHGVRGRKFIDWDVVAPEIQGTLHYVFADPSKAMMFKLAWGGV